MASIRKALIDFIPPQVAGVLLLIVVGCLLEWAVREDFISRTIVAKPSDALIGLVTLQRKVDLFGAVRTTFSIVAAAMALECLVAFPFGFFLFRRRDFGLAYTGWLAAFFAAPVFLLYPLFMVIFGRNQLTLIIMGFLPGVIPLIIHVEQGFLGVSRTLINVGLSFDLTPRQIFWKIMIPAACTEHLYRL